MNQPTQKVLTFLAIIFVVILLGAPKVNAEDASVKIHYLGHSSFVMIFDNGVIVVMDYGHYNAWVEWGWDSPIHDIGNLVPDIMTFSHQHEDHYDATRIPAGVPHVLTGMDSLEFNDISIKPIRTCEDDVNVESNTSYLFTYKGLRILHLGDAQAQIMNINNQEVCDHMLEIIPDSLDLLFMTIEGKSQFVMEAEQFVRMFSPKRIIPMHHWTEDYLQFFLDILEIQNLSGGTYQIEKFDSSEYSFSSTEEISPVKVICPKRGPFSLPTKVNSQNKQPNDFVLLQNYPNPFNPETHIQFRLDKPSEITLSVYNAAGQQIKVLHSGFLPAGLHQVDWNARDELEKSVSSGIYFYKITSAGMSQQRKMLVLK